VRRGQAHASVSAVLPFVRSLRRVAILVVLYLLPGAGQTPTFHSRVNLVNVSFSARDSAGKLVGDLNQDEVEVLEDGIPQKIKFFARTSDLPLTIGLIVDVSDSQEHFLKKHHQHVENFLKDVLGPQDQAFLICFGNHLRLVSDFTSSVPQIMDGFTRFAHGDMHFPELGPREDRTEGTAFYDSIYYAVQERLAKVDHGRRVLVVFSDGEDNSSAHHMIDAIETAQAADVLVYSIRYTEHKRGHLTARNKYGIRVMRRLSRDTGAADFDANQDPDLDRTFRQIGSELRSLYEVAYHTTNPVRDGTFRNVTVRTSRPGLAVRAKAGYFSEQ
jgi:Ca-activated chloride channel homolog